MDYEELGSAIDGEAELPADGAVDIEGAVDGSVDSDGATLGSVLTTGRVGDAPVLLGVQAATAPAAVMTRRMTSLFIQLSHWDARWAMGIDPRCGC